MSEFRKSIIIFPFDWSAWQDEAQEYVGNPNRVVTVWLQGQDSQAALYRGDAGYRARDMWFAGADWVAEDSADPPLSRPETSTQTGSAFVGVGQWGCSYCGIMPRWMKTMSGLFWYLRPGLMTTTCNSVSRNQKMGTVVLGDASFYGMEIKGVITLIEH